MPEYNKTVVRLIARQQGVGGYDSWGAHCNEIYKNNINTKKISGVSNLKQVSTHPILFSIINC